VKKIPLCVELDLQYANMLKIESSDFIMMSYLRHYLMMALTQIFYTEYYRKYVVTFTFPTEFLVYICVTFPPTIHLECWRRVLYETKGNGRMSTGRDDNMTRRPRIVRVKVGVFCFISLVLSFLVDRQQCRTIQQTEHILKK
jgi:hypothetical protein